MARIINYRITKHADNRFAVEVRNEDRAGWRTVGDFITWRDADAAMARLQKIARDAEVSALEPP